MRKIYIQGDYNSPVFYGTSLASDISKEEMDMQLLVSSSLHDGIGNPLQVLLSAGQCGSYASI